MRAPVASKIAFPIADEIIVMAVSPAPVAGLSVLLIRTIQFSGYRNQAANYGRSSNQLMSRSDRPTSLLPRARDSFLVERRLPFGFLARRDLKSDLIVARQTI